MKLIIEEKARKEGKRIPTEQYLLILDRLNQFKIDPFSIFFDVKKIHAKNEEYRLRVGKYRILYTIDSGTIKVFAILHRKDAYRYR